MSYSTRSIEHRFNLQTFTLAAGRGTPRFHAHTDPNEKCPCLFSSAHARLLTAIDIREQ
jgi:hypothetical protein